MPGRSIQPQIPLDGAGAKALIQTSQPVNKLPGILGSGQEDTRVRSLGLLQRSYRASNMCLNCQGFGPVTQVRTYNSLGEF